MNQFPPVIPFEATLPILAHFPTIATPTKLHTERPSFFFFQTLPFSLSRQLILMVRSACRGTSIVPGPRQIRMKQQVCPRCPALSLPFLEQIVAKDSLYEPRAVFELLCKPSKVIMSLEATVDAKVFPVRCLPYGLCYVQSQKLIAATQKRVAHFPLRRKSQRSIFWNQLLSQSVHSQRSIFLVIPVIIRCQYSPHFCTTNVNFVHWLRCSLAKRAYSNSADSLVEWQMRLHNGHANSAVVSFDNDNHDAITVLIWSTICYAWAVKKERGREREREWERKRERESWCCIAYRKRETHVTSDNRCICKKREERRRKFLGNYGEISLISSNHRCQLKQVTGLFSNKQNKRTVQNMGVWKERPFLNTFNTFSSFLRVIGRFFLFENTDKKLLRKYVY